MPRCVRQRLQLTSRMGILGKGSCGSFELPTSVRTSAFRGVVLAVVTGAKPTCLTFVVTRFLRTGVGAGTAVLSRCEPRRCCLAQLRSESEACFVRVSSPTPPSGDALDTVSAALFRRPLFLRAFAQHSCWTRVKCAFPTPSPSAGCGVRVLKST